MPLLARGAVYPESNEKLISTLSLLDDLNIPFKVTGGMTNLLVKNGIYEGVFVKTNKIQIKSLAENRLTLSCGVRMGGVIHSIASLGLGGMEGLSGIPGTVGGMVKQNAGAFGDEVSDRFLSAECYLLKEKKVAVLTKEEMRFGYRRSILGMTDTVLLSAVFSLLEKPCKQIKERIAECRGKRLSTQPSDLPSLGSVFKRYNGQSAGFYIERAGLKGAIVGGAKVSEKHAGFIVNFGGATADDFLRLIDLVKEKVYSDFGIELEEEIEII